MIRKKHFINKWSKNWCKEFITIINFLSPHVPFKVTGDSLLIHAFAYLLFIGFCWVTYNMTSYSHSYHSMKLIHCGAPQRDVLSDKMVLWVVTYSFYFMLCQSSLLSTVVSFVYKDKWWFDESMPVIFCMENTWKRIVLFPPHTNSWLN